MEGLKRARRRGGATRWGVFRDAVGPSRYLEVFIVGSWIEYLRQRECMSVAERELQDRVRAFHVAGEQPLVVSRFIAGALSSK